MQASRRGRPHACGSTVRFDLADSSTDESGYGQGAPAEDQRPVPWTNGDPGHRSRPPSHSVHPIPRQVHRCADRPARQLLGPACSSGPWGWIGGMGSSDQRFSLPSLARVAGPRGPTLGVLREEEQAACQRIEGLFSSGMRTDIVRISHRARRFARRGCSVVQHGLGLDPRLPAYAAKRPCHATFSAGQNWYGS
jgi:hypothetical protein